MATKQLTDAFDALNSKYKQVLKTCYDALDEGATQETRDAVRESLELYIDEDDKEAGLEE